MTQSGTQKSDSFTMALRDIAKGVFLWVKADTELKSPYELSNRVVDVAAVNKSKAEAAVFWRRGFAYFHR